MRKLAGSVAVFLFAIAISVFPFNAASAQTGGYVGVFGGYTFSSNASLRYYDYNYDYNYDLNIKNTWLLGAKFGFTPPPLKYFSLEFEYSYLNPGLDRAVSTQTGTNYTTTIEGDAKLNNFMFNAITKYPEGKIHPYFGAGLGFSYVDVSVSVTPASRSRGQYYGGSTSKSHTVFAWQVLAGMEIDFSDNWSVDIGYRYFATEPGSQSNHEYHGYDYYNSHLDYKTSMVTLGLKYRF